MFIHSRNRPTLILLRSSSIYATLVYLFCCASSLFSQVQDEAVESGVRFDPTSGTISIEFASVAKFLEKSQQPNVGEAADAIAVRLADVDDALKVLGKIKVNNEKKQFVFTSRFPFRPGTKLAIEFKGKNEISTLLGTVKLPAKSTKPTKIISVYPTQLTLPENLLKFYVHFSAPMQKGGIYKHLKIVDAKSNKEIELPFLELEQELWSRDHKRVTLLFDPGRIKRGLKPREEMGPIFLAGHEYRFVISGNWQDANGKPLGDDFIKEISICNSDSKSPEPSNWVASVPAVASKVPLEISFDEPLDSAIAKRVILIFKSGKIIDVDRVELVENERAIEVYPMKTWMPGDYEIRIGSDLEDLCGNRIGRLFDLDLKKDRMQTKNRHSRFNLELNRRLGNDQLLFLTQSKRISITS